MVPSITHLFVKLHGKMFEFYIRNTRTDRYNLICSIDAHKKQQPSISDECRRSGGNKLP